MNCMGAGTEVWDCLAERNTLCLGCRGAGGTVSTACWSLCAELCASGQAVWRRALPRCSGGGACSRNLSNRMH